MNQLGKTYVLLGAVSCLIGVVLCLVGRDRSILSRLALFLLPPMAFVVIWNWYFSLVINPSSPYDHLFSANRLVPTVALTYGYPPYYPANRGPVNGWVYAPAPVLAYLPATLFPDPIIAVLAGRCLSLFFYFGPLIGMLAIEVRRGRLKAEVACLLFTAFAVLSHRLIALLQVSTGIHADAPALGLGALALGLVGRIRGDRLGVTGVAAVLAAICATLSKQVQAPLLLMPGLWITASGGIRSGLRSLGITAVLVLVIVVPVSLILGPEELFFNTWTVPSHHGTKYPTMWENAMVVLWGLRVQIQRPLIVILLCTLASLVVVRVRHSDGLGALRDDPIWLSFLIGGVCEIPMALLGYVKYGGDFNALAFSLYPLAIAMILMLGRCVGSVPRLAALLIVLTLYLGVSESRYMMRQLAQFDKASSDGATLSSTWIAEERMVLRYLREHPGEAYFPYNILDHLAVEGRLYHFECGVDFQALAGYPLSPEHLRKFIPPRTRIICYPPGVSEYTTPRMPGYLGDFHTPVSDQELPGFTCFARSTVEGPVSTERNAVGKIPSGQTPGSGREVPARRSEATTPAAGATAR